MERKAPNVDAYIAGFPTAVQQLLNEMRKIIRKAAPKAEEKISYGIPAYRQNGNLVYFAAFKNHIGFYPTPSGIEKFKKELSSYKQSKGTVQFPLDQPLPADLISRIVKFRIAEDAERAKPAPAGFLSSLSQPAQRALMGKGIKTVKQLARYSEADILALHGVGPSSIPRLREALAAEGLQFKN
ncbi:Uncharacterized conserved protein YdhG, YjbR/CyaY-like superfamily, DUF1801 family [Chitinophaga terrae (ex Kim and Jung 2007)]|jgi:uncharacterized protein YdhG (YjbR/CyaY superfamily)|uniref:Uncharacterized conserved protein YdhG, YjbR/CyaY-like superfamily, DUF1801 family n=1 Tax=Chitinophaga terrae (ex Kim and Jung 2007) TaxID=408074 RepID=A0A1H4GFV8_9BACT|nr:DUF1801 domain-containing protein [Chitinophaga terrae (ex Kim and Jung 2007)]MDQ0110058.1 uncharacterized protein YdhG (YjbR/CyaY superfamily) [Chitinophaga terrae (ex Kim and Jung 2007)]GEP93414.1 hypothetical protein CTE07_50590 [Chitinophaga terrae (ex Kim and Jung 2007)]SEB08434.1 Uncharacterized conserved protein YdhG, YjbR/CyaY-like superfamily, DUF1801 family [Chitinophaga terrae (ex Kim and Jung 2007)]